MPSAIIPNPRAATPDDLDELFNFDAGIDEVANGRDSRTANEDAAQSASRTAQQTEASNMDEEIVVTKRRQPVAKLDETRLLSAAGIPRLRKAKNMRYKGKGHEFSDIQRLLRMYQVWLDELYPRAKFADGLAMIEKLGHKKTIQMMRKDWMNEGKRKQLEEDTAETLADTEPANQEAEGEMQPERSDQMRTSGEAMSGGQEKASSSESSRPMEEGRAPDVQPEEDELDALLAESEVTEPIQLSRNDTFADEEEAMADMGW